MMRELRYLLKYIGDPNPIVSKTEISGLTIAKTAIEPFEVIDKFRMILMQRPYEFRYSQRIIPLEKIVSTKTEEIKQMALQLSKRITDNQTFRITVEKRFTNIHSRDVIEAIAPSIPRKVDLKNPDRIMLVEIIGELTGIALIEPQQILTVEKEKMFGI